MLDTLRRIDAAEPLEENSALLPRLVENGLVTQDPEFPRLTDAGIELCKSLQHRLAADAQAEKILKRREAADGTAMSGADGDDRAKISRLGA
ncbi:MAG: hypothetical protein JF567_05140 [Xanthomonadales bacterium]|nr:hypothetical protein [Xanthomonadales bacterium]